MREVRAWPDVPPQAGRQAGPAAVRPRSSTGQGLGAGGGAASRPTSHRTRQRGQGAARRARHERETAPRHRRCRQASKALSPQAFERPRNEQGGADSLKEKKLKREKRARLAIRGLLRLRVLKVKLIYFKILLTMEDA